MYPPYNSQLLNPLCYKKLNWSPGLEQLRACFDSSTGCHHPSLWWEDAPGSLGNYCLTPKGQLLIISHRPLLLPSVMPSSPSSQQEWNRKSKGDPPQDPAPRTLSSTISHCKPLIIFRHPSSLPPLSFSTLPFSFSISGGNLPWFYTSEIIWIDCLCMVWSSPGIGNYEKQGNQIENTMKGFCGVVAVGEGKKTQTRKMDYIDVNSILQ